MNRISRNESRVAQLVTDMDEFLEKRLDGKMFLRDVPTSSDVGWRHSNASITSSSPSLTC